MHKAVDYLSVRALNGMLTSLDDYGARKFPALHAVKHARLAWTKILVIIAVNVTAIHGFQGARDRRRCSPVCTLYLSFKFESLLPREIERPQANLACLCGRAIATEYQAQDICAAAACREYK